MTSEHDSITTDFAANGLNQYPLASTPDVSQGMRYDEDGNMVESFVAGDMDCDGDVDFTDIDCLVAVLGSCLRSTVPCSAHSGMLNSRTYAKHVPFWSGSTSRASPMMWPSVTIQCVKAGAPGPLGHGYGV